MTGIAGIEPVSFISCIFPELACPAVASHTLRLSSILNLRTSLLLEILISVSGADRQPLMHFLGSTALSTDTENPGGIFFMV